MGTSKLSAARMLTAFALVAALLLPASGLAAANPGGEVSPAAPVAGSLDPAANPISGSVNPASGSAAGGETVTVTIDQPPHLTSSAQGDGFGLAVTDTGAVLAWGKGTEGQLGNGAKQDSLTPVLLEPAAFDGERVVEVFAGQSTAYAQTEAGTLYGWGKNVSSAPVKVDLFSDGSKVSQMAFAGEWSFELSETGKLVVVNPQGTSSEVMAGEQITQVAAHGDFVVVQKSSGEISTARTSDLNFAPLGSADATELAAGEGFLAGLTSQGEVWTANPDGDWDPAPLTSQASQIVSSGESLLVLGSEGNVFEWRPGANLESVSFGDLLDKTPAAVSAGFGAKTVLSDGALFAWGEGQSGQLGTGTADNQTAPAKSVNLWPTQISFGEHPGADLEARSASEVTVKTPPKGEGEVDVAVAYSPRSGDAAGAETFETVLEVPYAFESRPAALAGVVPLSSGALDRTWCDENPNVFYSLRTNKSYDAATRYNAIIDEYEIVDSGENGAKIEPKRTVLEENPYALGSAINWLRSGGPNALGVSPDGTAYFTYHYRYNQHEHFDVYTVDLTANNPKLERVVYRDTLVGRTSSGVTAGRILLSGGAVNPVDERFYFVATVDIPDDNNALELLVWTLTEENEAEQLRSFKIPANPRTGTEVAAETDISFDGVGNLIVLVGGKTQAVIGTIPADEVRLAEGEHEDLYEVQVSNPVNYMDTGEPPLGTAFSPEGYLIWQTEVTKPNMHTPDEGELLQLRNPVDQDVVFRLVSGGNKEFPRDLGSCATPPTMEIGKHVTERLSPKDQFIFGGGLSKEDFTSATTKGTQAGRQETVVGPLPVLLTGQNQLTVGEEMTEASATKDIKLYDPTLTCFDASEGDVATEANTFVEREPMRLRDGGSWGFPSIDFSGEEIDAAQGPRAKCTIYNDPTTPTKTAEPASGDYVSGGEEIEYTLTFDNPEGEEGKRSAVPWYVDYTDYLGDVLDDADLLDQQGEVIGEGGDPSDAFKGEGDIEQLGQDVEVLEYFPGEQTLRIRGLVPVDEDLDPENPKDYTVTFSVRVKGNLTDTQKRLEGAPAEDGGEDSTPKPAKVGYVLNNYLERTSATKLPTSCEGDNDQCTTHPVRSWTASKNAFPGSGEPVHEHGRIYYQIELENLTGGAIKNIKVHDDLSHVLWASRFLTEVSDPDAGDPETKRDLKADEWGVTFFDEDGNELADEALQGVKEQPQLGDKEVQIWPMFSCGGSPVADGEWVGWNPTAPQDTPCAHNDFTTEGNVQFTPWNWTWLNDGLSSDMASWTIETTPFGFPEGAQSAVVAFAVEIGDPAKPGAPEDPTPTPAGFEGTVGEYVPMPPNALLENGMWVGKAEVGSDPATEIPSLTCFGEDQNKEPVCSTSHRVAESFFHVRKFGVEGGKIHQVQPGTKLMITDTVEEAKKANPTPSKWLCHENNNPCKVPQGWKPGDDLVQTVGDPGKPECIYGSADEPMLPGSDGDQGDGDFGPHSAAHQAIAKWNAIAAEYNTHQADPNDREALRPQCGLFYQHDGEGGDEKGDFSWHVEDLRGGDLHGTKPTTQEELNAIQWRDLDDDSEHGEQGTYWLAETEAPEGYELLAQPQKFWVAPDVAPEQTQTPRNWSFYNCQGRVSLPAVGLGETLGDSGFLNPPTTPDVGNPPIRSICAGDWGELPVGDHTPPVNNQPACVSGNGWNLEIYDVAKPKLPLSGGQGYLWLWIVGALALAAPTGVVIRRRLQRG